MGTEAHGLTVAQIIDRQPLSRFQIATIGLCALVMVLDGFDTQCIGFLVPSIAEPFHLPLKAFTPVFAWALIGFMTASMIMGPVADRWGRKWPVVISTLIFATGLKLRRFLEGEPSAPTEWRQRASAFLVR